MCVCACVCVFVHACVCVLLVVRCHQVRDEGGVGEVLINSCMCACVCVCVRVCVCVCVYTRERVSRCSRAEQGKTGHDRTE